MDCSEKSRLCLFAAAADWIRLPPPQCGGSCEKIENRLFPALSVRRSARATLVERALRARFHR